MSDWDDVRFFLAVARTGSLGAAARSLRVNHTTVLRRIQALEKKLQAPLFVWVGSGRGLSEIGREILPHAERMEGELHALANQVAISDHHRSGVIRVSMPDGLAMSLFPQILAAFSQRDPEARVQLILANTPVDLLARQTDIELRPDLRPNEQLRGRRVSRIAFGIYASKAYMDRHARLAQARHAGDLAIRGLWILPDPSALSIYAPADWLHRTVPRGQVVATVGSAVVMRELTLQGIGLSALPCYLGDASRDLARLCLLEAGQWGDLWLLTHPQFSRLKRIRTFIDCATRVLSAQKSLIEGRGARGPGRASA